MATANAIAADARRATRTPRLVDVPELTFLMVDGRGDPAAGPAFRDAVRALFAVSYAVKFAIKRTGGPDHHVGSLEALWSAPAEGWARADRRDWSWTAMVAQPPQATEQMVRAGAAAKGVGADAGLRLERFGEGRAAQVLHVGPWADEVPTVELLHSFIRDQGLQPSGRHHEIYLSDPGRTAPERLRTILRQPCR